MFLNLATGSRTLTLLQKEADVIFTNLKKIVAFLKFLAGEDFPCFKSSATGFGSIPSVCVLCVCARDVHVCVFVCKIIFIFFIG